MTDRTPDPGERLFEALIPVALLRDEDWYQDWDGLLPVVRARYADAEIAVLRPAPATLLAVAEQTAADIGKHGA